MIGGFDKMEPISTERFINITIRYLHIKEQHQRRKRKTHAAKTRKDFTLQQTKSTGRPSGRYRYEIFLTSSLEHIIVKKLLSMLERLGFIN